MHPRAMCRADGYFADNSDRNLRICADKDCSEPDRRQDARNRRRTLPPVRRHRTALLPSLPQERGTVPAADYRKRRTYHENCSYLRERNHLSAFRPYRAVQAVRCGERRDQAQRGSRHERQRPRRSCRLPDRASGRRADLRRHRRRRTDCACAGGHSTVRRCFGQR